MKLFEFAYRFGAVGLYLVGNHDMPHILASVGNMDYRAGVMAITPIGADLIHEFGISDIHDPSVDLGFYAESGFLAYASDPLGIDVLSVSLHYGLRDRVSRMALGSRRDIEKLVLGEALRMYRGNGEVTLGESSRLIEYDGIGGGKRFEISRALHKDSLSRRASDRREE